MVITNARALRLAETHGLAGPRLIAADLDGRASGTVATLETFLSGSSDLPPMVLPPASGKPEPQSRGQRRRLGVTGRPAVPSRPIAVDDRATERRRGLDATTSLASGRRAGQVASRARGRVGVRAWRRLGRQHAVGGDRCVALIDWKTAGVGDPSRPRQPSDADGPSVRPGGASPCVGGLAATGRTGGNRSAAHWDAVAALNTPTVMQGWPGFADDGSPLDTAAVTERRDAFLRTALDRLPTPIS